MIEAFAKSRIPTANISARQAVLPFVSTVIGLSSDNVPSVSINVVSLPFASTCVATVAFGSIRFSIALSGSVMPSVTSRTSKIYPRTDCASYSSISCKNLSSVVSLNVYIFIYA